MPPGRELADDVQHLADELRVERARHLVQQHQLRSHRESPDDRDPLLLAAREAVRVVAGPVGQPEAAEQLKRLSLGLGPRRLQHLARRERHVAQDRHVREEVVGLEDDPDPAADPVGVHARCRHLLPADEDPALVDRLQEVDAPQQRRLARARGADQADDLVLADLEVDPVQHLVGAERLAHAVELDRAHRILRRCLAVSQSVNLAIGIVSATNMSAVAKYGV